mmetsp:Transcript_9791/g.30178  ORF Transcript_9791/g.30178 Transcript_9791/m.30178 type:complete len:1085 (+) Transcript_9791:104-3358(+)
MSSSRSSLSSSSHEENVTSGCGPFEEAGLRCRRTSLRYVEGIRRQSTYDTEEGEISQSIQDALQTDGDTDDKSADEKRSRKESRRASVSGSEPESSRLMRLNSSVLDLSSLAVDTRLELIISVNQGRNLVAKDVTGKSDPYVLIAAKDGKWSSPARRTRTIMHTLNPDWHEKLRLVIPLAHIGGQLHVQVWDRDMFKPDDFMGEIFLCINQSWTGKTVWYALKERKKGEKVSGTIALGIRMRLLESDSDVLEKSSTPRDLEISAPSSFQHKAHVDLNLNWRMSKNEFKVLEKIGQGAAGVVFLAKHVSGVKVAIKSVAMDMSTVEASSIEKEIFVLKTAHHPNIVPYLGCYAYSSKYLWIILEHCAGGSIRDYMVTCRPTLEEPVVCSVIRDVIAGLCYLHKAQIIHRDLKCGNILLGTDGIAKIADFGLARQLLSTPAHSICGTPLFMPPEVLAGDPYSFSADVWSLGITVLEMCEGKPPRADTHAMRAMFEIATQPPPTFKEPAKWTAECKSFLSACLHKDALYRATADDLHKHPFLQSHLPVSLGTLCLEYQARRKRLNKVRAEQQKVVMHLLSMQQDKDPVGAGDADGGSAASDAAQGGASDETLNSAFSEGTQENTVTTSPSGVWQTSPSPSPSPPTSDATSEPMHTDKSERSAGGLVRYTTAELELEDAPEDDENPLDQAHYSFGSSMFANVTLDHDLGEAVITPPATPMLDHQSLSNLWAVFDRTKPPTAPVSSFLDDSEGTTSAESDTASGGGAAAPEIAVTPSRRRKKGISSSAAAVSSSSTSSSKHSTSTRHRRRRSSSNRSRKSSATVATVVGDDPAPSLVATSSTPSSEPPAVVEVASPSNPPVAATTQTTVAQSKTALAQRSQRRRIRKQRSKSCDLTVDNVMYLSESLAEAHNLVKASQQRVSALQESVSLTNSMDDPQRKLAFVRQQTQYLQNVLLEQELRLKALEQACLASVAAEARAWTDQGAQEPHEELCDSEQEDEGEVKASRDVGKDTGSQASAKEVAGVQAAVDRHFSYATLVFQQPLEVDTTRREAYLSDDEFRVVFGMTRAEFARLPMWRRNDMKRRVKLF